MKPEVELKQDEMSKVVKVYRRYYRGEWYISETPQPNYNIVSYYATKVKTRLYYDTEEEAQERADKYNKRLKAYKKGQQTPFPSTISWYFFNSTEVQNPLIWWHDSGSWLYAHGYDDWDTEELLEDEMLFPYDDYGHTTVDFFNVLFNTEAFSEYEMKVDDNGNYKIFIKEEV